MKAVLLFLVVASTAIAQHEIWYQQPAKDWKDTKGSEKLPKIILAGKPIDNSDKRLTIE